MDKCRQGGARGLEIRKSVSPLWTATKHKSNYKENIAYYYWIDIRYSLFGHAF